MKKLNVVIVDDEQPARKLLENYVSKIEHLHLLGSFKNPLDTLTLLREQTVNILFLDIRMPEISGLDFLKTLKTPPAIILTTAYREYALDGYEHNVVDYLLKPIEFNRFVKGINKIKSYHPPQGYGSMRVTDIQSVFVNLKYNKRMHRVPIKSILYIKGENEYAKYCLEDKRNLLVYGALKNIEEELSVFRFYRIHRSYIVNLDMIDFIEGDTIVVKGYKLPIGKTYKYSFFRKCGL